MSIISNLKNKNIQAEKYLKSEEKYQYGKALNETHLQHPEYSGMVWLRYAVNLLTENLFSEKKMTLLRMFYAQSISQPELDCFIGDWDIETVSSAEAFLLACVQKECPGLNFGVCNGPRLCGLTDFYKFRSLDFMIYFSKIIRLLNDAGIIPLMMDGGPFETAHPGVYGLTQKINLAISSDVDLLLVKRIIIDSGYTCSRNAQILTVHFKGKAGEGTIRISSFSFFAEKMGERFANYIYAGATQQECFNAKVLLPSPDEQCCMLLLRIGHTIRNDCNLQSLSFSFAGLASLLRSKGNIDHNTLSHYMQCAETGTEILLSIFLVNRIIPGLIPEKIIPEAEYESVANRQADLDYKYYNMAFGSPMARQLTVFCGLFKRKIMLWFER